MVLFMARPFKHPKTGVYWFRKVVPASMRPLVRKVEERRSLRTKDPRQAALRFTEVAAKVAAEWEALRRGPVMADLARSFVQQLDPDGRAALAEDLLEVDLRAVGVLDERELPYDWEPGDRTPATQKAISRVLERQGRHHEARSGAWGRRGDGPADQPCIGAQRRLAASVLAGSPPTEIDPSG